MLPDLTSAQIFDETAALSMMDGDRDLLVEVVEIFRDCASSQIADLSVAINAGHADEVSRLAHTLKGGATSICAERIGQLAHTIEESADADCRALFDALQVEFRRFCEEVFLAP